MKVFKELPIGIKEKTYIALGNFDGVHVGHKKLIEKMVDKSKDEGKASIVFTLDPHPLKILGKNNSIKYITSEKTKIQKLEELDVDYLVLYPFSLDIAKLTPIEFIQKVLVKELNAAQCFVGFNYSFGKGGAGSPELLAEMGTRFGFNTTIVPPVYYENRVVSSSWIRETLLAGDLKLANELLSTTYSVSGKVIHGNKLGRKINFPTANVELDLDMIYPAPGVYVVNVLVEKKIYRGVANIGYKPTLESSEKKLTLEVHILNFSKDIYGIDVTIFFLQKIRDEKKFISIDQLALQIQEDSLKAINF